MSPHDLPAPSWATSLVAWLLWVLACLFLLGLCAGTWALLIVPIP